jgi:hypothetical protein
MAKILKNFCSATLASNMLIGDTQITVSPGHNLPVTAGEFVLVFWNMAVYPNPADDSSTEIVTAEYSGTPNVYNVTRAQESTVAIAHSSGDAAALHLTAGTMIHNNFGNLDYASSGHTGFEPTVSKGNLTAGSTKISIGGIGTGALIGTGATIDVVPGNIAHNSLSTIGANDHHNQAHVLNSSDHTVSGLTTGHVLQALTPTTFGFAAVPGLHDAVTLATSADVLLGLSGQALSLDTQVTKQVLIGPISGDDAAPTFRVLETTDIPALAYETSGAIATHAALLTGVHGLAITAGQTLTVTASSSLNQDCRTTASPSLAGLSLNPVTIGPSQLLIQNNSTGCFSTLAYGPDNNAFGFDVYWSGAGWVATDTSCFWLYKVTDCLDFEYDNGRTVGGSASTHTAIRVHGTAASAFAAMDTEFFGNIFAATIRANTAFNLSGTNGVTQAASAGTVVDSTSLAGGIVTGKTQITYIADGAYSLVGITSITTANGRITAMA